MGSLSWKLKGLSRVCVLIFVNSSSSSLEKELTKVSSSLPSIFPFNPNFRAHLSRASPHAMSTVLTRTWCFANDSRSTSIVCPPLQRRLRNGNLGGGFVCSSDVKDAIIKWPNIWCTPTNGLSHATLNPLANWSPALKEPTIPGPLVQHIRSGLFCEDILCFWKNCDAWLAIWYWWNPWASVGITPPAATEFNVSFTWSITVVFPSFLSNNAMHASSQDDSIARTRYRLLNTRPTAPLLRHSITFNMPIASLYTLPRVMFPAYVFHVFSVLKIQHSRTPFLASHWGIAST